MNRTMLRIIAAAVPCVAAAMVGTSAANASTPTPVQPSAASTVSLVPYSEVCQQIGTSDQYGNAGVACATLWYAQDGSTEYFDAENSIYCVDSSGNVIDCEGIQETVGMCFAGGAGCPYTQSGICGGVFGHSDCGTRIVSNFSGVVSFDPCYPNTWADALNTEIILPHSGNEVGGPGANVASAHFPAACNA